MNLELKIYITIYTATNFNDASCARHEQGECKVCRAVWQDIWGVPNMNATTTALVDVNVVNANAIVGYNLEKQNACRLNWMLERG